MLNDLAGPSAGPLSRKTYSIPFQLLNHSSSNSSDSSVKLDLEEPIVKEGKNAEWLDQGRILRLKSSFLVLNKDLQKLKLDCS